MKKIQKGRVCRQAGFTAPAAPLIIVVLILTVAGVFYLNRSSISKVSPLTPPATITPSPTSDETVNPDLIEANWKTYTSKFQDYSLRYPANWRLVEDDSGITLEPILKSKYIITISGPSVNSGESVEEIIPRMQGIISKTEITIGKYTGIKLESEQISKELNRYQRATSIVFENLSSALAHGKPGDKGYLAINLEISDKSQVQEVEEIFNQILSTFKFTD